MTFSATFFIQFTGFILLSVVLTVCVISLFIRPARRTVRAAVTDNFNGKIYDIRHAETSIGKARSCDIVLNAVSVSRFHCVLSNSQNGWMIFDTNSSTGVYVNGKKIKSKQALKQDDIIQIGAMEFTFHPNGVKDTISQQNKKTAGKNVKLKKTSQTGRYNFGGKKTKTD